MGVPALIQQRFHEVLWIEIAHGCVCHTHMSVGVVVMPVILSAYTVSQELAVGADPSCTAALVALADEHRRSRWARGGVAK